MNNRLTDRLFRSEKARWILALVYKDKNLLLISLLLGLITNALGLGIAVFSEKLIDQIIPSKSVTYLLQAIGVLLLLVAFKLAAVYFQGYVSSLHGKRFNIRLIDNFFSKMIFLPKSFFDINKTGTLITRMHDSASIQDTVIFISNVLVLNALSLLMSTVFLFKYSTYIGFLAFIALPLFLISSLFFKNIMRDRLQAMYIANGENESNYIASIQNADLIKMHNKQHHYIRQNAAKYGYSQEKSFKTALANIYFTFASETIGGLCYILILGLAAYECIAGRMSIGEFTATLSVATGMLAPIHVLGNALFHLQGARVAFDRMYEVISAKSEFHEQDDAIKEKPHQIHHINVNDVSFSYDADIPLLEHINFSARQGDIVCIFGRNGSGKSTLLNLLVALYHADSGFIAINGKSISELSIVELRNRVAIVSQQTKLFDGSLMQNICMSDDERDLSAAITFLGERGFDPFIGRINGAYFATIAEDGNNLSGGQKQIIALARALYKKPDVLLVDEATAALDGDAEEFVIKILQEFAQSGGIVIMVSHRLKPARISSKIVVIDKRTVQQIGDHDTLLQTENLYSKRYNAAERKRKLKNSESPGV